MWNHSRAPKNEIPVCGMFLLFFPRSSERRSSAHFCATRKIPIKHHIFLLLGVLFFREGWVGTFGTGGTYRHWHTLHFTHYEYLQRIYRRTCTAQSRLVDLKNNCPAYRVSAQLKTAQVIASALYSSSYEKI